MKLRKVSTPEVFEQPCMDLVKEGTMTMAADIFTKGFTDSFKMGPCMYPHQYASPPRAQN